MSAVLEQPPVFSSTVLDHQTSNPPEVEETHLTDPYLRPEDLTSEFVIDVPWDYDPANQLQKFHKGYSRNFSVYDPVLADRNFQGNSLQPRRRYQARIEPVVPHDAVKTGYECLDIYANNRAILTNAQGLTLAYAQAPKRFPPGLWVVSFDDFSRLYSCFGNARVPFMLRHTNGEMVFSTEDAVTFSHCNFCLLFFKEFLI